MSFEDSLVQERPAPLVGSGDGWDDPESEEVDEDLDEADDRDSEDDDTE
jgi:hypothetical protein